MTTSADSPEAKARRIVERQLESIGFDLDANARDTTVSLERRLELLARRKELEKLARMLGMEPAEFAPQEIAR